MHLNQNNQQERTIFSEQEKYFYGGLFEGDGSLYVSLKKNNSSKYGYYIDPGFGFYQLSSSINLLTRSKELFKTGSISAKSGSPNVYQHIITNRRTVTERVIPFYNKYVFPFSGAGKQKDFLIYKGIVEALNKKEHSTKTGFINIVKLCYKIKAHHGSSSRKRPIEEIIGILRD